jgi:hypothetical protein
MEFSIGLVCRFSISCPVPTPHAPIAWSYHLGAWDGVGTARTTQSGRYGPEKLSPPPPVPRQPVGALPPSPEQRGKAAPLGKGVKPPCRAGYCRELEATGGGGLPTGEPIPRFRLLGLVIAGCYTQSSVLRNVNLRNRWWGGARKRINQKGSEPGNAITPGDFP